MESKSDDVIMSTTPSTTHPSTSSSCSFAPISSIYHSISTAHPASTVTHACTGHFTSPDAVNLITAKCTRLEIHRFQHETLEAPISVPIYGRISALRLFRAKGETQDRLLVVTERYKFCVLAYDMKTNEIVTKANGDIRHKMGQPCDSGHNVIIDPLTRLIGLHMYQGIFQAIPIDSRGMLSQEAIDMRLDEIHVHQMTFLHGTVKPTIALIYEDSKQKRFIKSYEVNLKDKTLGEGPWAPSQLENGATWLIPIPTPFGGILIIGEEVISYYTGKQFKITKIRPAQITAWGMIDSARYLLGDLSGNLHVLVLKHDGNNILSLHLDTVGVISIANTITYLDSGYVHIGSIYGDSQLIKLNAEKNAEGNYVDIITTFPNLGSIMDMTVIDLDRQGQGQIVTCSGAYKDGSLRIIRNGIGINEEASIELPGMKGVWSLRPETASPYHKFLVESFVGETRVLAIEDEELGEMEIPGFESTAQTLFCGNVVDNVLLQVTSNSVRLVDCTNLDSIQIWTPPNNAHITVAHANTTQLLVATGAILYLLNITNRKVVQDAMVTLDYEVSCIDVSPLGDATSSTVAAIGMWTDISVRILSLPSLKEITRTKLDGQIIPRSVMFVQFEQTCYLLCGLGDGHLYNFEYDVKQQTLQNHKKIALGSQPIALSTFKTKDTIHVFASCDRPTVIYSIHNKLLYSNVNLKDVNYMTPFNAEVFRGCLAFATEESLTIGNIDEIQKLHIRSIPLGEQPTRIAHQASSHTLCVTTKAYVREDTTGSYGELNHVKLFDDTSMEMIHSMTLDTHESVASIGSIKFDEYYYYVVGTAYVLSDEPEPTHGRLLFYRVIDKKLVSVATIHTKGAVYTLTGFHGKLVCGINSKVQLYDVKTHVTSDGTNLRVTPECSHHGNIIVWSIRTIADFIVVADVMKSVSLLVYKAQTQTIEELSRDYDCNWMTSVEILNDQTYLGTDHAFNMFTLRRNVDAITDEDRARLETVGRYHVGEYINQIQKGSLVMNLPDSDNEHRVVPSHLFGAFSGLIGVIAPLTKSQYTFLSRLETILESVIHGIGGLSHSEWRSFHNERKTETKSNFVDGDLIEMTLELPTNKLQQVATQMNCSVEELTKRVEEATRVH